MLTLPFNFDELLARPHKIQWLFELYYDSSNFIGLSFDDVDISTYYHGAILNRPSIREKLSVSKSKASSSNISLTVANFQYNGAPLSQELFGGSNKYINKNCIIKMHIADSPFNDWDSITTNWESDTRDWDAIGAILQIYQGRIDSISHTADKITIKIAQKSPWDNISIPSTLSTTKNIYFPIAYGDFTASESTTSAPVYCGGKTLFPIPVAEKRNDSIYSLALADQAMSDTGTASPNPHIYDKNLDRFIPVYTDSTTDADDVSETYENGKALKTIHTLKRAFKFKPVAVESAGGWTNGEYAFNSPTADDTSNGATIQHVRTAAGTTVNTLELKLPQIAGKITRFEIQAKLNINAGMTLIINTPLATFDLFNTTYGLNASFAGLGVTIDDDPTSVNTTYEVTSGNIVSNYNSGSGLDVIKLKISTNLALGGSDVGRVEANYTLYDVRILVTCELDFAEDAIQSSMKVLEDLDWLYSGGDGYNKDYTDGGGAKVEEIHQAHRDLLSRFAGVDDSDSDIDGWTAVDADKDGWKIRWWVNEPMELSKILLKLQYEGGFAFWITGQNKMKYWSLRSKTNSSADITLTKNDVSDLKITHTPFKSLITSWDLNYEKHPAGRGYVSTQSVANSSARSDWNIETKENVKSVNLDALTENVYVHASDPSTDDPEDSFVGYYDAILGDIGLRIGGKILNPAIAYQAELGDVVVFTDAPTSKFFGETISGKEFIIDSLTKSQSEASFTLFEIIK